MATYRRGFKKVTPEQRLLQVIVGIIIFVFAIVAIAFIYDLTIGSRTYEDFTQITTYESVLTQKDSESNQLQDYVVYFYQDTCEACASVENKVLRLTDRINKDATVVFFANTGKMTDTDTKKNDFLVSIEESNLLTPTIVVVANGVFQEVVVGADQVVSLLDQIKDGTYAPFND